MRVDVAVVVGYAVMTKRGVEVMDGTSVCVALGLFEGVPVLEAVSVPVPVPVVVPVGVGVRVRVVDELGEAGGGVTLVDAASFPTVISTPQASGIVRVAEYTHVGSSLTPLIWRVGPQAKERRKVRLQVGDTGASGP